MKTFFDLKKTGASILILLAFLFSPGMISAQSVVTFSTLKFIRTAGPTNVFSQTMTVPSSVVAPFTLSMMNGDLSATHGVSISGTVSSGSVLVDGIEVIGPKDFSKEVREVTKPLTLSPGNHLLDVSLDGKPNSFITLTFLGIQSTPSSISPSGSNPFSGK